MNNQVNWMQQGWECPKCGAVMSPTTSCCVNCRGNKGGGIATTSPTAINGDPIWNDPSSICGTSGPLDPPYMLTNEAPKVEYSKFCTKSVAVGVPNPTFDAAGGPPELSFDNSGYKEDPEEQWERYQLNI